MRREPRSQTDVGQNERQNGRTKRRTYSKLKEGSRDKLFALSIDHGRYDHGSAAV